MAQQTSAKTVLALGKLIVDRVFPSPAADEHADIDGTYTYLGTDFKGQDFAKTVDIIIGEFAVPHRDENNIISGIFTWQSVGVVPEGDVIEVHETSTATIKGKTFTGAELSVAKGGFYEEGKPYKFCLQGDHGNYIDITITNVGAGLREAVVESVKH